MDVAGGFSSILDLLKLKDLVRKKKQMKNERTKAVLRCEKLKEKSPDLKKLENVSLGCNEISNNSANIVCKETKHNSINIDHKDYTASKNDEFRTFNKIDLMPSKIPTTFKPILPTQSPNNEKIQIVFSSYKKTNYMCELCGVIIRRSSMETHMNMHLNRKPFVCNFKNCGRSFTSSSTLSKHRKVHSLSKEFTCDICSATFHFGANLRKHKESHLEPRFKCMICDHMFKTKETLKSHMNKHKDSENLSCTQPSCDKKFKNSISLREHVRRFHKIRIRERIAK